MNKLAIVIPYYKIDFFEETLKSVAAQSNRNFTLYIGNDASPDDPKQIIDQYFDESSHHYFNYNNNLGGKNLALQWERILENVKEDWFQILGDDDMLSENFVDEFYDSLDTLDRENINVLKFPVKIIDAKNKFIKQFSFSKSIINRKDFLISRIDHVSLSSLSENIFRTETYRKHKINQFPLAWHSDDCMIFDYAENDRILYSEKSYIFIRNSGLNISSLSNNSKEKSQATNAFYGYIISRYYHLFTSEQKKILLNCLKKHYYYTGKKATSNIIFTVSRDNIINGIRLIKYLF